MMMVIYNYVFVEMKIEKNNWIFFKTRFMPENKCTYW